MLHSFFYIDKIYHPNYTKDISIIVIIIIIEGRIYGRFKYSKQRASIKDYLMHTTSHPTADTVYLHIKEEFPNISLGTVYRNLNLLADIGEALRIPTPDGGDRFDGRCEAHYHVVCTNCGNVFDLEMDDSYIQKINEDANKCFDGIIESHTTLFRGLCGECAKKLNENK